MVINTDISWENQYLHMLHHIMKHGVEKDDRTGTGVRSVPGMFIKVPVSIDNFPIVTTKYIHFKSVVAELLWFLKGYTNIKWLNERGVTIWDEWADENGDLGPIYGKQWVDWNGVNQIQNAMDQIKNNPTSRRIIVSAWNVDDLPKMALYPCHVMHQYIVENDTLHMVMYQRSADMFLGFPFNISSYSLLLLFVCKETGLTPGTLTITVGDAHIYSNHFKQVRKQLKVEPFRCPSIWINPEKNIFDYDIDDIKLVNYKHGPRLPAPVAV